MLHRRWAMIAGLATLVALGGCTPMPDDPPPETRTPTPTSSLAKDPANGELAVVEQGFSVLLQDDSVGHQLSFAAILENTSTTDAVAGGTITVSWYDANGTLLKMGGTSDDVDATASRNAAEVPPGERSAVSGTFFVAGAPARMEVVPTLFWRPAADVVDIGALTATNVVLAPDPADPSRKTIYFAIDSARANPVDGFAAVLFRDAAGTLLGGNDSASQTLSGLTDASTLQLEVDTGEIPDSTVDANTDVVLSAKPVMR